MISVITPCLNSAMHLDQAIRSVCVQQCSDFEHIVIDGGSEDGSLDIIRRYPHLKWISEPDGGQSDAMNKGFKMSRGEIIVYLNADDYFQPGAFEKALNKISSTSRFVVGNVEVLKPDGQGFINDPKVELEEMLRWWQPNAYCYNSAGYFYDRKIQQAVGGFSESDHLTMDYEFLIRARQITSFTKIESVLASFRLFPGTKTYENQDGEQATFARFDGYLELVEESERKKILEEKRAFFSMGSSRDG